MTWRREQRWVPTANPEVTALILEHRYNEVTLRRFFEKVDYGFADTDCHIWTGALSDEGYGNFWIGGKASNGGRSIRAHRVRWLWAYGAMTDDLPFLDHAVSCIGRFCVNLTHLEPVDNAENQRRRTNVGAAGQRVLRSMELILRDERRAAGEDDVF